VQEAWRSELARLGWQQEKLVGGERWTSEDTTGYADVVITRGGELWVSSNKPAKLLQFFTAYQLPEYKVTARTSEEAK